MLEQKTDLRGGYGRLEIEDSATFVDDPRLTEVAARSSKPPTLRNFTVRPSEAQAGQTLNFTVETKRAGTDPMSEELIVYNLQTGEARAFAPPRRGSPLREVGAAKAGWPDGTWTATIPAPTTPGKYTFVTHSTSEHCVSSNRLDLEVVVR